MAALTRFERVSIRFRVRHSVAALDFTTASVARGMLGSPFLWFLVRDGVRLVRTFGILGGVPVDPWSVHKVASGCLRFVG